MLIIIIIVLGRIGRAQHLAGGILVVSQRCSGGAQWSLGNDWEPFYTNIQLGFKRHSIVVTDSRFCLYIMWMCGGSAPCGPNTPLAAERASLAHKTYRLALPLVMGQNLRNLSKSCFYIFRLFQGAQGALRGLRAGGRMLWLVYYFTVPAAPRRLNATWF